MDSITADVAESAADVGAYARSPYSHPNTGHGYGEYYGSGGYGYGAHHYSRYYSDTAPMPASGDQWAASGHQGNYYSADYWRTSGPVAQSVLATDGEHYSHMGYVQPPATYAGSPPLVEAASPGQVSDDSDRRNSSARYNE